MSRGSASKEKKQENGLIRYFKETRAEIAKVTWPTRQEGMRLTAIVMVVTLISAAVLFGLDSLFSLLIGLLIQTA